MDTNTIIIYVTAGIVALIMFGVAIFYRPNSQK